MATYKQIRGINIQSLDADPDAYEGDVWYNATTSLLKMYTYGTGAWASGGNLGTARYDVGGAGTQTASIMFGGNTQPSNAVSALNELYDGSSWSEVNDLNTAKQRRGG